MLVLHAVMHVRFMMTVQELESPADRAFPPVPLENEIANVLPVVRAQELRVSATNGSVKRRFLFRFWCLWLPLALLPSGIDSNAPSFRFLLSLLFLS